MSIFHDVFLKPFKQGYLYHNHEERLSEAAGFLEGHGADKVNLKENKKRFSVCVCVVFFKVELTLIFSSVELPDFENWHFW